MISLKLVVVKSRIYLHLNVYELIGGSQLKIGPAFVYGNLRSHNKPLWFNTAFSEVPQHILSNRRFMVTQMSKQVCKRFRNEVLILPIYLSPLVQGNQEVVV